MTFNFNSSLNKKHLAAGLHLIAGTHSFVLQGPDGNELARFPLSATVEEVHRAADQAMEWQKSGVELGTVS